MKTAMQEWIETLENRLNTINNETTHLREQMIQTILVDAERYIEKEKQQIIDAYIQCWMDDGGNGTTMIKLAEEYYNETYGSDDKE